MQLYWNTGRNQHVIFYTLIRKLSDSIHQCWCAYVNRWFFVQNGVFKNLDKAQISYFNLQKFSNTYHNLRLRDTSITTCANEIVAQTLCSLWVCVVCAINSRDSLNVQRLSAASKQISQIDCQTHLSSIIRTLDPLVYRLDWVSNIVAICTQFRIFHKM